MVEGFVSGHGYGRGSTSSAVNSAIHATQNRIHDDALIKGGVGQAAGTASGRTGGLGQNSFSAPSGGHQPMREPSSASVMDDVNKLRETNRREESGDGRVQTTAPGMAKEGVGKVLPGVVDSQGNRPTSRGYFNKTSVVHGVDMPEPGPIPQNAPSTFGGRK